MKKKVLGGIVAISIAIFTFINVNNSNQNDIFENILLSNVEALASEAKYKFWCCGNCCVCAIGDDIVIHGHASTSKC